MATWNEFAEAEPDLAATVQRLFEAARHKTIATIRADGSPRISGIECEFADGQLRFGSMPDARKGADLKRDPRFALHGPTVDPIEGSEAEWPGEAKVAGRARLDVAETEPDAETEGHSDELPADSFVADIDEVVFTHLNDEATKLVIEFWTPHDGLRHVERD